MPHKTDRELFIALIEDYRDFLNEDGDMVFRMPAEDWVDEWIEKHRVDPLDVCPIISEPPALCMKNERIEMIKKRLHGIPKDSGMGFSIEFIEFVSHTAENLEYLIKLFSLYPFMGAGTLTPNADPPEMLSDFNKDFLETPMTVISPPFPASMHQAIEEEIEFYEKISGISPLMQQFPDNEVRKERNEVMKKVDEYRQKPGYQKIKISPEKEK